MPERCEQRQTGARQLTWTTVAVPIQEAEWAVEAGTWGDLLSSVDRLRIRIELVSNPAGIVDDSDGIDNVRLLGPADAPGIGAIGTLLLAFALAATAQRAIAAWGSRTWP